ncbi:hypothetical protein CARUB_v10003409mg [Capsella rubella]|uniref:Tetrahydrofolate dehydrogenase/cyclohydrolase NAD(P)-binding domain-containing protein n=2 Tax=Capsella rubella TaxID=81985 RepID=R0HFY1_9BRAS|nr:hypothetical protein CARUB_v10003409mg [Capsella rubella]
MVIDEFSVACNIMREIRTEISRMNKSIGAVPGLAVILIGGSPEVYKILGGLAGVNTTVVRLAKDVSEEKVLKYVSRFNDDPRFHGILVELPLPPHMDEHNIFNAVNVEKDVGGFHSLNIGRLAMRGREPLFVPRSPQVCMELLHRSNIEIKGKRAVVIGRSHTFDIPAALLLQREDATVTIINSRTKNPEEITRQADIIISGFRQPNMVRGSWIKPGAVVINVWTSLVVDRNDPSGFRDVRDICYEEVSKVASAVASVECHRGVFPIVVLLSNTLTAAKRKHNFM